MIRIEHLKKVYPNATPLEDVNVEIHDGDVISVIGPSGTGKSTLLRCINQLEKPTSGKIWLDDVEITGPKCDINKVRQRMGMVFQTPEATQKAAPRPFPKAGQLGITDVLWAVSTRRLWNAGLPRPVGSGGGLRGVPSLPVAQTRHRVVLQPEQFG